MRKPFAIFCVSALTSFLALQATDLFGQVAEPEKVERNDFIRLTRDNANEPVALQTAIRTYKPREGLSTLRVDLIGAVHVLSLIHI